MRLIVKQGLGKLIEISELVSKISFADQLNNGCSKLEFSYINNNLVIENGDELKLEYENLIFVGRVFKVNRDKGKEIKVTAYDQLRYAKGKDYFTSKGNTLSALTKKMCTHFKFNQGSIAESRYVLATHSYDGDTWIDILYSGIDEMLACKNIWYVLRDEGGYVSLRDISELTLDLVLGDDSMCFEFDYGKSIDDNFYNQIIILAKKTNSSGNASDSSGSTSGSKVVGILGAKDETSISRYGQMQYYESVDNKSAAQAQDYANSLLKLYNEERKTLTLECLGDSRIRAGNSIYGQINEIGLGKRLIVRAVTHDFIPIHTMKLEVIL